MPRWVKIGPRVSPGAPLTPTYRGMSVGHFWANMDFRQFLAILAFLRKSPNMAYPPPQIRSTPHRYEKLIHGTLGPQIYGGSAKPRGGQGFITHMDATWVGTRRIEF